MMASTNTTRHDDMTAQQRTNGCHNRPEFRTGLVVQDGWFMDGVTRVPRMISVPFRMSPACQYRHTELGKADPGCQGCRHR